MTIDTPHWVRDAVFYQVFPDRFAVVDRACRSPGRWSPGTRRRPTTASRAATCCGIAERLPYLADLGVNALYLTPIFASASNHRYHTYDYLQVDPLLGGDDALRELLDAAHARGHARRARRRVQPHGPRVLGVPPRPRERRRLPVPRLVPLLAGRARGPAPVPARIPWPTDPRRRRGRAVHRHRRTTSAATSPCAAWGTGPGGACRPCRS